MKKKIIYNVLICFCLCGLICSSLGIYYNYKEDQRDAILALEGQVEKENINDYEKEIKKLQEEYNNEDIMGIINIPGTNLNQAFVKTTDNKYYLKHTLSKEESKIGAVFMDYRNNLDDRQVNIYGHNYNKTYVPFKELLKFQDKEFAKNNNTVYITTKDGVREYKIVIVKKSKSTEHMNMNFNDIKTWNNHIKILREDALYDTKESLTWNDNILVLQTCILTRGNYLTLVAKRVK